MWQLLPSTRPHLFFILPPHPILPHPRILAYPPVHTPFNPPPPSPHPPILPRHTYPVDWCGLPLCLPALCVRVVCTVSKWRPSHPHRPVSHPGPELNKLLLTTPITNYPFLASALHAYHLIPSCQASSRIRILVTPPTVYTPFTPSTQNLWAGVWMCRGASQC